MKSVLISIQPKWCELIASGKKTVEVRKTKPKLETPFKVYIYETRNGGHRCRNCKENAETCYSYAPKGVGCYNGRGRVIGEFVCDRIDDFYCASIPYRKENNLGYGYFIDNGVYKVDGWHEGVVFERSGPRIDTMLKNTDLENMCLSAQEIFDYIGIGKHLYAWHISDLKIYDKPRELSEFFLARHCFNYKNVDIVENAMGDYVTQYFNNPLCRRCIYYDNGLNWCEKIDGRKTITRPPQSWCYVEDTE